MCARKAPSSPSRFKIHAAPVDVAGEFRQWTIGELAYSLNQQGVSWQRHRRWAVKNFHEDSRVSRG
jgi:hypothetical protein